MKGLIYLLGVCVGVVMTALGFEWWAVLLGGVAGAGVWWGWGWEKR